MKPREDRVVLLFLSIFGFVVVALTALSLNGARRQDSLELVADARERAALIMAGLQDPADGSANQDPEILGYGLYTPNGEALTRWGTAPDRLASVPSLRPSPSGRTNYRMDWKRRTVRLTTLARGPMMMPPPIPSGIRQPRHGSPVYMFVEMRMANHWHTQRRFAVAQLGVPVLVAAAAALIGYLYLQNSRYRRRMAGQQELARLGEAARTLAHEIKNPLGTIRVQTAYLKKTLPAERSADLDVIEHEVLRLTTLTDRIGSYLRDPRGNPRSVELAGFLRELCTRAEEVALEIRDPRPVSVKFDPDRLRSVVENLIGNAVESHRESGRSPEVTVTLAREKDSVVIHILDRGVGIGEEDRERVFDPFYTTKTTGSGVGLALTRRFVEAAGGSIALSSRPGGGTDATLTLRAS